MSIVTIERKILEKNDAVAAQNRALLARHGVFCINVVSSPGAGKTCLLERTLEELGPSLRVQVIEGDVQTDLDARRIDRHGVPVVQLVTQGACHLEAQLVHDALLQLDLHGTHLLVIENVGNLVCPASFDLGEDCKVVVTSLTEGDDKPLKYPAMFRNAAALVINKIDLAPYVPCDLEVLQRHAMQVNPDLRVFATSALTRAGILEWCDWLRERSVGKK